MNNRDPRQPKETIIHPDGTVSDDELNVIRPENRLDSLTKIIGSWTKDSNWTISASYLANPNSPFYSVNGKLLLESISTYWSKKNVAVDFNSIKMHISVESDSAIGSSNGVCQHVDTKVACTDSIAISNMNFAYEIDRNEINKNDIKIPMAIPGSTYVPIHISDAFIAKHPGVVPEVFLHELKHHLETIFAATLIRVIYVRFGIRVARTVSQKIEQKDIYLNTILDKKESLTEKSESTFKSSYNIWNDKISKIFDAILEKAGKYASEHQDK